MLPGEDQGTERPPTVSRDPGCNGLGLGCVPRSEVVLDELAVLGRVSSLTLNYFNQQQAVERDSRGGWVALSLVLPRAMGEAEPSC